MWMNSRITPNLRIDIGWKFAEYLRKIWLNPEEKNNREYDLY